MKKELREKWEAVIGLEIHAQLNTKSKMFSSAPNRFGDEPNTNITEVCTGQPGALPVVNKEAVKKAVAFGLAIGAKISDFTTFDRKSYFYPDSPRNFQITQFENPIVGRGTVFADVDGVKKEFIIEHAHLEDDAGMLKHFSNFAGVDYNRAGAPLIEIVSEPCIHSPQEASAYAKAIKAIVQYIGASDCNMEQGQLRFDANISVRPKGDTTLRNKTEIKNMNSFTFLELAAEAEIERQILLYTENHHKPHTDVIKQGTYRWDSETKSIILMRTKESAADYRYFPEPDLTPIVLSKEYIEKVREELPELPADRFDRYVSELELSAYAASILTLDKTLSDYFEEALKYSSCTKTVCNWITVEFAGKLKDTGNTLFSLGIPAKHIGKLVDLIDKKTITGKIAKSVADDMIKDPKRDPEEIVNSNPDYKPVADTSTIEPLVDQVLSNNPTSIEDYKAGKKKAFAFLVGQVMKLTKGKASPAVVNDLINKKLDS